MGNTRNQLKPLYGTGLLCQALVQNFSPPKFIGSDEPLNLNTSLFHPVIRLPKDISLRFIQQVGTVSTGDTKGKNGITVLKDVHFFMPDIPSIDHMYIKETLERFCKKGDVIQFHGVVGNYIRKNGECSYSLEIMDAPQVISKYTF